MYWVQVLQYVNANGTRVAGSEVVGTTESAQHGFKAARTPSIMIVCITASVSSAAKDDKESGTRKKQRITTIRPIICLTVSVPDIENGQFRMQFSIRLLSADTSFAASIKACDFARKRSRTPTACLVVLVCSSLGLSGDQASTFEQ